MFPEFSTGLSSQPGSKCTLLNKPINPEVEISKGIYVEKLNLTTKRRGMNLYALFRRGDQWLRERIGCVCVGRWVEDTAGHVILDLGGPGGRQGDKAKGRTLEDNHKSLNQCHWSKVTKMTFMKISFVAEGRVDSRQGVQVRQFSNAGVRRQTSSGASGNSKAVWMHILRMEHVPQNKQYKTKGTSQAFFQATFTVYEVLSYLW